MRVLGNVRAQVRALVVGMILLVVIVGSAGILGVVFATGTLGNVTDRIVPADTANSAILQDLTVAETSIRGWSLAGDEEYLRPYRRAIQELPGDESTLASLTEDQPELRRLVLEQERATKDWLDSYPRVRIRLPAGPNTFRPRLSAVGKDKFDAMRTLNAGIGAELDRRVEQSRARADRTLGWTVLVVALVALVGAAVALFFGRLTGHQIAEPLVELQEAVDRMTSGDTDARAVPSGPRETRKVAYAVNAFADENESVRALEQQVADQLRDLDRAKSDFLSNVSHELRTPLTSIGGYVELFEDDFIGELTASQVAMLRVITRNVDRLKALIEDLLTLSRTESEAFRTAFDLLDLGHLTSDVAYDMQAAAAEKSVTISEMHPNHQMLMNGDAGQLSRALLNLLSNAVKFSDVGGTVTMRLTCDVDGRAVVEVVDEGIGVPAAEIPKLATRFFRASNAVGAEITGTGLGLRIVQTIADNHGGRLEMESVEGEGTTARLVIPMRRGNKPHEAGLART